MGKISKNQRFLKALTLIEVIIVLAIILILIFVAYAQIKQRSTAQGRDVKRVSEVNTLRTALQLYYMDHGEYPKYDGDPSDPNAWCSIEALVGEPDYCGDLRDAIEPYLTEIPQDPRYGETEDGKIYSYRYITEVSGQKYTIHTDLEREIEQKEYYEISIGVGIVSPLCGDGNLDAGETCDDGNAIDCDPYPGCSADCQSWQECSDGDVDSECGEQCDGDDLNEETCETLGLPGGTLTCAANCTFDTSGCGVPPLPEVYFDPSTYSPNEDGGPINMIVKLSSLSSEDVTVDYAVTGGTATEGTDYTYDSSPVTILAGDAQASITFTPVDDSTYEDDETAIFKITGATNANVGSPDQATVTIVDDESPPLPTVSFSSATYSVNENGGSVNITVNISESAPVGGALVDYSTSDGTATGGSSCGSGIDYVSTSGTLNWAEGDSSSKSFTVTICDDTTYEGDENVDLALSNISGANYGTYQTADLTIVDDEASGNQFATPLGGGRIDYGYSIQKTSDGGYIVTGLTQSFGAGSSALFLVKLDSSGNHSWSKAVGGASGEFGHSVQQTSDGGYIVTGGTDSYGAGNKDLFLVKLDSSGNVSWSRTVGGAGYDEGNSVQQTSDGGYIVTGLTQSFDAGSSDLFLVKFDSSGSVSWSRTVGGGGGYDEGFSVQQTSDGGYIVTGCTGNYGAGSSDLFLVKFDSSGSVSWSRTVGGAGKECGHSIQKTSDGGYIVTGGTKSYGAGSSDLFLVKFDSSGSVSWSRTVGGEGVDYGHSVQQTSDGGYIVTGETRSFDAGNNGLFLVKFNSSGNVSWSRTVGRSLCDEGKSVQQTTDGGYIVTGVTDDFSTGGSDLFLVKFDSAGHTCISEGSPVVSVSSPSPTVTSPAISAGTPSPVINSPTIISASASPNVCALCPSAPANVSFSSPTYSVDEGGGSVTITVNISESPNYTGTAYVDYSTSDNTATGGAACSAGVDYRNRSGTLSWKVCDGSSKSFTVTICDDSEYEGDETINLTLSNPQNVELGSPSSAVLTIVDDDPGLYERYNTGDDTQLDIFGMDWYAQTFTIGNTGENEDHNITKVKLKLLRVGSPGTITVGIRAVNGAHKPTGEDLAVGTTNGDTLTEDSAGEWREIAMTSYTLLASTEYAIVVRAPGGSMFNRIKWRADFSSPTYTGGIQIYTWNAGADWTVYTDKDFMFGEWGGQ